jgi:tetratricopeptide (TPR) repeat protein
MNTLPMLLLAIAASGVTSAVVTTVARPDAQTVAASADPDEVDRLARALAGVETRQAEVARALADLRAEIDAAPRGEARLPLGEIEASVARALAKLAPQDAAAPAPSESPKKPKAKITAQRALDLLTGSDLGESESQAIWNDVVESGEVDALLALYEARVAADPNDPDLRVDLGRAYLQKLFTVGDGPEKGTWAVKADQAFDEALALDETNWPARFAKAVSLSFWPPIFGKGPEAIKQFETLVAQQQGQAPQADFLQSHVLLGQLYIQQGQKEKAVAVWQKGLLQFPGNEHLETLIASAQSE